MKNPLRTAREQLARPVVREGAWVAASQVMSALSRLVGLRLLTELLAPDTYAEVVLLVGLATLGANVLCFPVLESAQRFYPEAARDGRVAALRGLLGPMLAGRVAVVAAVIVLGGAAWTLGAESSPGVLAFALLAAFFALDQRRAFEQALLNSARRQAPWSQWNILDVWARPLLAAGFVALAGANASSALLGYAAAIALGNVVFRRRAIRPEPAPTTASEDTRAWTEATRSDVVRYATPLIPLAVLGWVMTLSDRYLVAGLVSAEEAGIYAAAYGLASQPFITAASALSRTLRPIFNDAVAREDVRRERRVLALWLGTVAAVLLVGLALLIWLAEPLVGLILGDAFQSSTVFLPWIAATYVLQGLQQVFEAIIYAQRRTRRFLVVWILASSTALGLYLLWIPEYGAMGAAMGTLAGVAVSFSATVALSGTLVRLARGESLGRPD